MRIAAKRLRYILEVTAETCFGPYAETALKRTKELQDLLGEIHDCDVQLPRVRERLDELRAADARTARLRAPANARDLDPTFATRTANARAWRGLETLAVYLQARRELLFQRFLEMWTRPRARRVPRPPAVRGRPSGPSSGNSDLHRTATATPVASAIASPAALR